MAQIRKIERSQLDEILDNAEDLTNNEVAYITNTRFHVSTNEVTIDLFYVAPNPKNASDAPIAQRVYRIVMPLALAKNTGILLLKGVTEWEEKIGIELPFAPQNIEDIEDDTE